MAAEAAKGQGTVSLSLTKAPQDHYEVFVGFLLYFTRICETALICVKATKKIRFHVLIYSLHSSVYEQSGFYFVLHRAREHDAIFT